MTSTRFFESVDVPDPREIGWYPIHAVASADNSVFRFPPSEMVFHWHGETFNLPPGAVRLAESEGCKRRVIGLQLHLETTPASAMAIIASCREELVPSRYIQTEDEI